MPDWKERLVELGELIQARADAEDEEEARELGRRIEGISDELRRVWQMTDEQIGDALRKGMSES